MKKNKLFSLFILVLSFTCLSCEEETSVSCSADAAYNNYIEALNSFSSNPTRTNCNNLKSKANTFIDRAETCGGFDASSAHNSINQIDCSDF